MPRPQDRKLVSFRGSFKISDEHLRPLYGSPLPPGLNVFHLVQYSKYLYKRECPTCLVPSMKRENVLGTSSLEDLFSRANKNCVFQCLCCPLSKWRNMVYAANKERYSSINRITVVERATLGEVDRPSPHSAIFISVTKGRRLRRKTRFSFGSTSLHVI